jgi:peroxiredoxin
VNNSSDLTKCDEELGEKIKQFTDKDKLMSKFTSIITATCDAALKVSKAGDRVTKGRKVRWWTGELTIL